MNPESTDATLDAAEPLSLHITMADDRQYVTQLDSVAADKMDEGYSEDTRSLSDVDTPMSMDAKPDEAVLPNDLAVMPLPQFIADLGEIARQRKNPQTLA